MDRKTGKESMIEIAGLPEIGELTSEMLEYKRKLDAVLRSPLVTEDAIASRLVEIATFCVDPEELTRIMEDLSERVRQIAEEKYGLLAPARNRTLSSMRIGLSEEDDDAPRRMVLKL